MEILAEAAKLDSSFPWQLLWKGVVSVVGVLGTVVGFISYIENKAQNKRKKREQAEKDRSSANKFRKDNEAIFIARRNEVREKERIVWELEEKVRNIKRNEESYDIPISVKMSAAGKDMKAASGVGRFSS